MNFLYHLVPTDMQGQVLYPMTDLKIKFPKLYARALKSYEGRQEVMQTRIPPLNCFWNDVVHLTAVHPQDLKKGLQVANVLTINKVAWYKINPLDLEVPKAVVYVPEGDKITFETFDPRRISKYSRLPRRTIAHYKEEVASGRNPFWFAFTPHVFYKGSIDVRKAEVIEI